MKEEVLQLIWQKQLFNHTNLSSSNGESLTILNPGELNLDQGPDFSKASIILNQVKLSGAVEIHLRSSDWKRHRHQYDNVILHVVLIHDLDLRDVSGFQLPVLVLLNRLHTDLLPKLQLLLDARAYIRCGSLLNEIGMDKVKQLLEKSGAKRLEANYQVMKHWMLEWKGDRELLAFFLFLKSAGLPQNTLAMEALFKALPWSLLRRKLSSAQDWWTVLLGTSNLTFWLSKEEQQIIQLKYPYWKRLFNLEPIPIMLWKSGKMRPANRPDRRLKALSVLFNQIESPALFLENLGQGISLGPRMDLHPEINAWKNVLMINAVSPYWYWKEKEDRLPDQGRSQAISILRRLPAEDNRYTRIFRDAGYLPQSALESQGAIHQFRTHCNPGHCWSCSLIKPLFHKEEE